MSVEFVVAMAQNRVIGRDNALPWHSPEDLAFFKEVTMGTPMVMGRKTYDSIGRLLPGRDSIIVTRQADYAVPGAIVAASVEEALAAAAGSPTGRATGRITVIGGAEIFRAALPMADVIHLTLVHGDYEGDTVFPELDPGWRETHRTDLPGHDGSPAISFIMLERPSR
jgi:dihydrofolate reductase